jgi:hypothetical protein
MGITWCPGCGIGHAISWLIHGNLINSWHAHWLGVPALLMIVYRIYVLGRKLLASPQLLSKGEGLPQESFLHKMN